MELTIRTNNAPRDLLSWYELTDAERLDLDYVDDADDRGMDFFRYRGHVYDTHEFVRIEHVSKRSNPYCMTIHDDDDPMLAYDGYQSDSYFSGIAIRYTDEFERIVVASVYA